MIAYVALSVSILALVISALAYKLSREKHTHELAADFMKASGPLYDLVMLVKGPDIPPNLVEELAPYTRWDDARFDKLYEEVAQGIPSIAKSLLPLRGPVATLYSLASARTGRHATWPPSDTVVWTNARRDIRRGLHGIEHSFGVDYPFESVSRVKQ